jgi:class 3 adenylate cyclase
MPALFRENDIDETVPSLTHENLKELGVASFGHRVKLLDAIAALRNDASVQTPSVAATPTRPSAATPTAAPVAEAVGERRHVTVMFCDLVGSTSISAAIDAEDWRDLVGAYLDAASAAVTEMGGHVAKKLGDGLMALFGYPVAQENDAERAARAALSIQRSLSEINRKNAGAGKPALNARIGIETGPVVVDAAGEIYGDAPNTAARVQTLAEPGAVMVTARVQRQITGLALPNTWAYRPVALQRNGDRLSHWRLRRGCAWAHGRAQRRSWRRCSLRCDWRHAFCAVFRLPRTRRPTRRLRCPDHGGWRRRLGVSGTRLGAAQAVGCAKRLVRRPSRRVL